MIATPAPAERATAVDPSAQPAASRRDLWVELGQDALGQPIAVPVTVLRGRREGPVVGLSAALHGDELNGIAVLHRLLDALDPAELRGSLVLLLVANLPGFQASARRYVDGNDLNHLMPGAPEGKEAELYAHRLLERVLAPCERLFDLHTASLDRVNCYYVRADLTRPETARMAWLQRPRILLHAPASPTTLRGVFAAAGKPAITLEIGDPRDWQPELVEAATAGLRANLIDLGMLPEPSATAPGDPRASAAGPIVCARSSWIRTDRGGLAAILPELGQALDEGATIARLVDVFGQAVASFRAPEPGVVIGRARSPALRSGGRLLHLGRLAAPGDFPALDALTEGLLPPRSQPPGRASEEA